MKDGGRDRIAPPGDAGASRGSRDDFFCWKFQIWYPSRDCVHRHSQRTYPGCAGCFQGRMNQRYVEKGLPVPLGIPLEERESA